MKKKIVKKERKSLVEQQREILERIKTQSLVPISEFSERENVILFCDNSGSMAGEKLRALKEAILEFILTKGRIDPRDLTCLVTFGDQPKKRFDFTRNKKLVDQEVSQLKASGDTPMGEGLCLCRELLKERERGGPYRIILLSDGQATDDPQRSKKEVRALKELKVIIDTIGFGQGGDIDEDLLKEIAEITGGRYLHVRDINQLPKTYVRLAKKKMLPSETKFFLKEK